MAENLPLGGHARRRSVGTKHRATEALASDPNMEAMRRRLQREGVGAIAEDEEDEDAGSRVEDEDEDKVADIAGNFSSSFFVDPRALDALTQPGPARRRSDKPRRRPAPTRSRPPPSRRNQEKDNAERARILSQRAEDQCLQQLRGIFAAFDENRDGVLTREELSAALLSLGLHPTRDVLDRFARSTKDKSALIDLSTFIRVCMTELPFATPTTVDAIDALFREFDPDQDGVVTAGVLKHLLSEVASPTALSASETADVLRMAGLSGDHVASVEDHGGARFNVKRLLREMSFHPTEVATRALRAREDSHWLNRIAHEELSLGAGARQAKRGGQR